MATAWDRMVAAAERRQPARSSAGFTLLEMLISLLLLMFAIALAAQLLVESAQMFNDIAGEQRDPAVPLALARLRNDVEGAATFQDLSADPLNCALALSGGPPGIVLYTLSRGELRRSTMAADGTPGADGVALRQVTAWRCQAQGAPGGAGVLKLSLSYRRRAMRHSPLPTLPAASPPGSEERTETLFLALRGAGLRGSW